MPRYEIDLNPLEHITVDAIGKPGSRVFYIQGWRKTDPQPVTIIIEKVQLQSLALGVDQMLDELAKQKPELGVVDSGFDEDKMHISPPVDPLFAAGELGLGYDADHDKIVILVPRGDHGRRRPRASRRGALCVHALADSPIGRLERGSGDRGRPICPQCGQPMEPEGHFLSQEEWAQALVLL